MNKLSLSKVVKGILELQDIGESTTILGIGPMSKNAIQAALELSKNDDYPVMFIASRNQVDLDELGGGYVNGWNQFTFKKAVEEVARSINYNNYYYMCRDHGGPWQRDEERNSHLEEKKAMDIAKKSYIADIEAGFDLLMIDPTKDPFEMGKVIPLDVVIERTLELIEFCENERIERDLPEIGYEVGTEETNGGLTTTDTYEKFIIELQSKLTERKLPMPVFIVGQTGTLVKKTIQAGTFNFENALELSRMAKQYGVGLKEHNGDYLDDVSLLEHKPANIAATNVAPQYGTEETRAYLKLYELEKNLVKHNLVKDPSKLKEVLLLHSIKSERWRKWMVGDQKELTVKEIQADNDLSLQILDIAGHYTFNNNEVKLEIEKLYTNLTLNNINGKRFVIDHIKRPIRDYAESFNLKGATSRINNILTK
ncbi:class II D-tagatose-bisphosphate aldolase non-catalytic subunit [Alkalibacterium olivapovliticus]|uniref:Tagatose-1,6-bisphosphate aldolase non-catalytic subunit AgaZ/GatZ n=1 Tax=Alkalibacterium olivapovliticus TaxID=99907 RepID=A0A2T0W6Q8_9LACT|nr:class II D-tagatose-bisphosphate aldolase, non-catalytic subunit [Alkalibacterium olivapovliticus]PRY82385.1 tagatose-1,6-bisphosphate aldolase non-catalytic subunit AgaZ/GatZ [Alkalibacterium olivapovliticus]